MKVRSSQRYTPFFVQNGVCIRKYQGITSIRYQT